MHQVPFFNGRSRFSTRARGYFDALVSGSFKATEDGRRLFFPFGALGRAYAIASEEVHQGLRRRVKALLVIQLALIIVAIVLAAHPDRGSHLASSRHRVMDGARCRHLPRTDDRLSLREGIEAQARAHSMASLWLLEVAALTLLCAGAHIVLVDRSKRLLATIAIAFAGSTAIMFTRMLVIRRH